MKDYLTAKEYEIMTILWQSDRPLSSAEILASSSNRSFSDHSLHALINNLLKKGYITVTGKVACTRTKARLYTYAMSIEEYSSMQILDVYSKSSSKFNVTNLLSFLVKENKNEIENIEELDEWIDQHSK